jgi:hypothetical protein
VQPSDSTATCLDTCPAAWNAAQHLCSHTQREIQALTLTLNGALLVGWWLHRAWPRHGLQVVALAVLIELGPQPADQGAKLIVGVCVCGGGGVKAAGVEAYGQW